jgi:GT2 family glycosyltransferase
MIARLEPRVTVVVLTRDHADAVCGTVAHLLELPERPPVIVVDNASSDGTSRVLRARYPNLTVLSLARNIGSAGRNAGARRATTPYVAFSDDDTWWEPGALGRAAAMLDAVPRLALVTGRVLVAPDYHEAPMCGRMALSPLPRERDLPGCTLLEFLAGATVARREALMDVGGFDPHFLAGGEERLLAVDLAARGWAIAYVPELLALQHPAPAGDGMERCWMEIRNQLWFAWLRRPAAVALKETLRVARAARTDVFSRRALREALAEVGWVWHRRAVVPAHVERQLQLLEQAAGAAPRGPLLREAMG